MDKSHLIGTFGDEYFTLQGLTARRGVQVVRELRELNTFIGAKPIEEATDNDLRAWMVSMLNGDLSPNTVGFALKCVKPFYRWLWQRRIITAESHDRIRQVKQPRGAGGGKPRPYSTNELGQFWDDLDAKWPYMDPDLFERRLARLRKGTMGPVRLRRAMMRFQVDVIVELALVCGLRSVEIYRLNVDDLHPDNHYLVVHGKRENQNDKIREVPYPDSTREAVKKWFRCRRALGITSSLPWVLARGSMTEEMTFDTLGRLMARIGDGWELHRFRHTCATLRLRAGMDLHALQRFLGHATIQQTLMYAELLSGDIHKAAAKTEDKFQVSIRRKEVVLDGEDRPPPH
jgi:site-specific recombinase XerD